MGSRVDACEGLAVFVLDTADSGIKYSHPVVCFPWQWVTCKSFCWHRNNCLLFKALSEKADLILWPSKKDGLVW